MIRGMKQEYECMANQSSRLTRDVEYYLEVNHPRKLAKNNFGGKTISHETVDDWGNVLIREIILERNGEYCLVNYVQNNQKKGSVLASPCVYVAEPIAVGFCKEDSKEED